MKKLPIGIQTFSELIIDNYLYIDKTGILHKIITGGKPYFLSRPRRFGKSLTISTLDAIFQGKRELFKGLAIDKADYNWNVYPVIRFDMGKLANETPAELKKSIILALEARAEQNNITLKQNADISYLFSTLIERLAHQSEYKKVVVLIDEYDKPILDQILNNDIARANREILRSFYTILKSSDEYIKFCFITGVTKFAHTSIFSGLNNLDDLTLDARAATLCGYTQEELEENFAGKYMEELAAKENLEHAGLLSKIKYWYNGYKFGRSDTCIKVYNPFSVLHVFQKKEFLDYWFSTGTPTFLIKLLKDTYYPVDALDGVSVANSQMDTFDIDNLELPILLFQSGYLTIQTYDAETKNLTLQFPNHEIESAFLGHVINAMASIKQAITNTCSVKLRQALLGGNLEQAVEVIQRFFAGIPYGIQIEHEHYYQTLFYCLCDLAGFMPLAEVQTNVGRVDLLLETNDRYFIFELKINKQSHVALDQILEKKYYERYVGRGKPVILVGMSFDTKLRNVDKELAIKILS
jgi:Protein of unknown function (DUF1703)./Predicted AAA-ATPase.